MAERGHERGQMTVREAGRLGGKEVQHQRDLRDSKEIMDDPYNKPGPAKGEAYGIAAVTQALHGVDFPTTKEALLDHVGDQEIEFRKGQPVSLRRLIEDAPADDYPSMANVVEAVSDAIHEEGLSGP